MNINPLINLCIVCVTQLHQIYFAIAINCLDTYMCKKTTFIKFHITAKINLVEVHYYFKQVFRLLYDKSVMQVEALLYFSLI